MHDIVGTYLQESPHTRVFRSTQGSTEVLVFLFQMIRVAQYLNMRITGGVGRGVKQATSTHNILNTSFELIAGHTEICIMQRIQIYN